MNEWISVGALISFEQILDIALTPLSFYGTLYCLSVFSPNAGKYGPEKLRIRTLFTQCVFSTLPNIYDQTFDQNN